MENVKASPRPGSISLPNTGRNTPTPSRPSTPQQQLTSQAADLPTHAGFDLKAIKDALKEVQQDPDARSRQQPTPATTKRPSLFNLVPPQFSHRAHSVPESHTQETKSHQRSNSLDDGYATVPPDLDRGPRTADFTPTGNEDLVSTPLNQNQSLFLSSLPGDAVPSWSASSNSVNNTFSPMTAKPFTTSLPSPPMNAYSTFSNPFASPDHDRTPVLSFAVGELDAKPFNQSVSNKSYAWDLPPLGTEKKSSNADASFSANPWS